ncbi:MULTISPECIES: conjugal transfer protein TraH [Methylomonas]|uniref:Conjugal transfer protein n=2 Tax=Methylomonas TaxID=416 RepID=A0A140E7B0_9GAMM|nr:MULTISPECIES: conjugal transfer protein TraH [Methylomonas]AMK79284.1 conjugal transfer protein [Methylomonas denitrificans]OAI03281.1 conjugal transfer protein [Methylomonas methanica]TCV86196.1 conjugative transfer pilus assembly protein TraH [Methylomonas methanica]
MNSFPLRRFVVLLLLIETSVPAYADLQQEMDGMFGTMTNFTAPTAHLGQRRGVITGGSLVARNGITNTNLVSFVPPSFSAGCGGIDLFGGSFSFINFNQFVQLLRNVAGNAAGYAFQLAVGAMCPWCASVMTDLQKKIQEMNQMFSNSCRLSQGLVNDTVKAFDLQSKVNLSNASFTQGISDVFSSWTNTSTLGDPVQQVKQNAPNDMTQKIQGNLVWRALVNQNAGAWFRFGGNDLLQAAMSISGTVIVDAPQAAADGKGENNAISAPPPILRIKDLMYGNDAGNSYQTVNLYVCSDGTGADQCLKPIVRNVNLVGLKQRVMEMLLGSANNGNGLIYKFATNSGQITAAEQAFMQTVPDAIGGMIHNLAREDAGIAKLWAEEAAPVIALDLAQLIVNDVLNAVQVAVQINDHAYAKLLMDSLSVARQQIQDEYVTIAGRYGNPQTLMAFYQQLMNTVKPRQYGSVTQVSATGTAWPSP